MFPDGRRPHFIIIGAVKGATTWIAHQLRCHPNLWLPKTEPHSVSYTHLTLPTTPYV